MCDCEFQADLLRLHEGKKGVGGGIQTMGIQNLSHQPDTLQWLDYTCDLLIDHWAMGVSVHVCQLKLRMDSMYTTCLVKTATMRNTSSHARSLPALWRWPQLFFIICCLTPSRPQRAISGRNEEHYLIQLPIYLSIYLAIYLSIYPAIHLSIHPSIYMSVFISAQPQVRGHTVRPWKVAWSWNVCTCARSLDDHEKPEPWACKSTSPHSANDHKSKPILQQTPTWITPWLTHTQQELRVPRWAVSLITTGETIGPWLVLGTLKTGCHLWEDWISVYER